MNDLYGIAWLAKRSCSTKKQIPWVFFRISSLGLFFWPMAGIAISARVIVCCCCWRGRGGIEKNGDMSNYDPSPQSSNVGHFFKTGVLVVLIKLEHCVIPATMLNQEPMAPG